MVKCGRKSHSSFDDVEPYDRALLLAVGECAGEPKPPVETSPRHMACEGDDGKADERPASDGPARWRVKSRHLAAARAATAGRMSGGRLGSKGRDDRRWSGGVGRPEKEAVGLA